MPPIEEHDRWQKAVHWPITGKTRHNEPTKGAAEELDARWKWGRRSVTSAQGTPVAVDATVIVVQEVAVGDLMWLGELSEWNATGSAGPNTSVMEVLTYSETPDIKGRFVRYELGLAYFRDRMPADG